MTSTVVYPPQPNIFYDCAESGYWYITENDASRTCHYDRCSHTTTDIATGFTNKLEVTGVNVYSPVTDVDVDVREELDVQITSYNSDMVLWRSHITSQLDWVIIGSSTVYTAGFYEVECNGNVNGTDCSESKTKFHAPEWCQEGFNCPGTPPSADLFIIENFYGNASCVTHKTTALRLNAGEVCNLQNTKLHWKFVDLDSGEAITENPDTDTLYLFKHAEEELCAASVGVGRTVNLVSCNRTDPRQMWKWTKVLGERHFRIQGKRNASNGDLKSKECFHANAGENISATKDNCGLAAAIGQEDFLYLKVLQSL
ncbi:MAG: hypothetical protein HRU20_28660 [Pseudomonadales bacterium]|nr:hypothetical protein [Pseudomonadales bacterium]